MGGGELFEGEGQAAEGEVGPGAEGVEGEGYCGCIGHDCELY